MDAAELTRWTRFAAKGGIGKCTATQDCVAENADDLMFLKDDEITVLVQVAGETNQYLGYCEGVVGRFDASYVRFHSKLKRPVITRRPSSSTSSPNSTQTTPITNDLEVDFAATPVASPMTQQSFVNDLPEIPDQIEDESPPLPVQAPEPTQDPSVRVPTPDHPQGVVGLGIQPSLTDLQPTPLTLDEELAPVSEVPLTSQSTSGADQTTPSGSSPLTLPTVQCKEPTPPETQPPPSQPAATASSTDDRPISSHSTIDDQDQSMSQLSRMSFMSSDDEFGIGMNMLQGMADIEGEDGYSSEGGFEDAKSSLTPAPLGPVPSLDPISPSIPYSPPNLTSTSSSDSLEETLPRPLSFHPSGSDAGDEGYSDWDGGDIYDNYRYSRFSMMSKMSRSSFSKMSIRTTDTAPPVPADASAWGALERRYDSARPSLDMQYNPRSGRSDSADSSRNPMITAHAPGNPSSLSSPVDLSVPVVSLSEVPARRIPPPLDLTTSVPPRAPFMLSHHNDHPSLDMGNLLHTNFPSPSTTFSPAISSPLLSPHSPSPSLLSQGGRGGAASALRHMIEVERGVSPNPSIQSRNVEQTEKSEKDIVVDDDDLATALPKEEDDHRSPDVTQDSVDTAVTAYTSVTADTSVKADDEGQLLDRQPMVSHEDSPLLSPRTAPASLYPQDLPSPGLVPPTTATSVIDQHDQTPNVQNESASLSSRNGDSLQPRSQASPFLPHPNAPKPNPHGPSQPLGRLPQLVPQPTVSSIYDTLRMAKAISNRLGPDGNPISVTIYGRTLQDLSVAVGPVLTEWSINPFNDTHDQNRNDQRQEPHGESRRVPHRAATLAPKVSGFFGKGEAPTPQMEKPAPSGVIPRSNFLPQVGVSRPRSRSFSGVGNFTPPGARKQAREEGSKPSKLSGFFSKVKGGSSVPNTPTLNSQTEPSKEPITATPQPRPHTSPLSSSSSSQSNSVLSPRPTNLTTPMTSSPLSRPPISLPGTQQLPPVVNPNPIPPNPPATISRAPSAPSKGLRQVASSITLRSRSQSPLISGSLFTPTRANSNSSEHPTLPQSPPVPDPRRVRTSISSQQLQDKTIPMPKSRVSTTEKEVISENNSTTSTPRVMSPPPPSGDDVLPSSFTRSNSIKSKLSLSSLRPRRDSKSKDKETDTPSFMSTPLPPTPILEFAPPTETVQIKDTDFELVRPTLPRPSSDRASEDLSAPPSVYPESRSDSPALSMLSANVNMPTMTRAPSNLSEVTSVTSKNQEIEAHRARELKWISAMSTTPDSQAGKTKKIRKLLLEGVPSSVRYLVWAHLAGSKSRRIVGVYTQLGKRGRVPSTPEIEKDAQACFADSPHVHAPLVSLLHAYMTMVPDVEYQRSMAIIAGHLLLQSPEEDAFWTFLTLMDTHLRTYFSPRAVQMEIDASLFGKALESADPQVAKRLFVDMNFTPSQICRPWFTSLFANTLPAEYVNRIWDIYFFDGPPFLFRVGLAIISSCRHRLVDSTSDRKALLSLLSKPPTFLLPAEPDDLVAQALSMKLKDDDVRRQRVKLEAQERKRQTPQAGSSRVAGSNISLPRS